MQLRPFPAIALTGVLFCIPVLLVKASPPATAPATQPAGGRSLFDGKTLQGWTVSDFGGHGDPAVEDGKLVIPVGEGLTGVTYAGKLPKANYQVSLDARRTQGHDFFCGLTFPVGDSFASLIVGGWGGGVCGISSLDDNDASSNDTTTRRKFDNDKWYHIRLRVTDDKIQAWIDDEKIVDVVTTGKKISVRGDIEQSCPFGLATWRTAAELKDIRIVELSGKP